MNVCNECTRVPHSDISIMCFADDERELKDNIDACPFCRALSITPQSGGRAPCHSRYTMYECGAKIVVNYLARMFVALGEISGECIANKLFGRDSEDVIWWPERATAVVIVNAS